MCEGYTDVIGFFQAGVPRAVATCGTALAEEHFTLLRNFGRRIVLAYDADGAGQSATSRVYEWERKHEVDVVVADLPSGSDPGDLARSDPAALARAVAEARPFLQFRVDRILSGERPDHGRGPGPGRRVGPERGGRASRRSRPRPVRHAAFGPLPARRASPARTARAPARPSTGRAAAHAAIEPEHARTIPGDVREPDDDASDWDEPVTSGVPVTQKDGPGLEALKLAVHRPEEVADRLQAGPLRRPVAARRVQRAGAPRRSPRRHRHRRPPKWPACCAG